MKEERPRETKAEKELKGKERVNKRGVGGDEAKEKGGRRVESVLLGGREGGRQPCSVLQVFSPPPPPLLHASLIVVTLTERNVLPVLRAEVGGGLLQTLSATSRRSPTELLRARRSARGLGLCWVFFCFFFLRMLAKAKCYLLRL